MKRVICTLLLLMLSLPAMAQTTAREWLDRLDASLGARYAMQLYVALGEVRNVADQYSGYFIVDGDAYYMNLGVMEVYSDGKLRYEVNNERKEVTEDRVNLEAVDLLSNPTRAFDFVDEEYDVRVVSVAGDVATIELKPKSADLGITAILLTLQREGRSVIPTLICYDYEGDEIRIELTMVDATSAPMPRWDAKSYRAYDIVSFL
ncbi:MAG: hypothetical protein J6V59_03780 [Alistipes sp.]|nr:hypothetical protein [Alistipes sp.]